MTAAIALNGVEYRYALQPVFNGLDLQVEPGEIVALLGPSGSGKSTLIRLILGLEVPSKGSISLNGEVASRDGQVLTSAEQRGIGVVFQDLALWPHLTVFENLNFGLRMKKLSRQARCDRIRSLLTRVGLSNKERRYPSELSGGERQRVAIARALALEPRSILLDEPLSNLDVGLKRDLLAMFRELLSFHHVAALYVTHDFREAASIGDRIAILQEGRVVQSGAMEAIKTKPASEFVQSLIDDLNWCGMAGA